MKKFTKLLSLALIAVMCTLALTSCGLFSATPNENIDEAEKALIDVYGKDNVERSEVSEDYTVLSAENNKNEDEEGYETVYIRYFKTEAAAEKYWNENGPVLEARIEVEIINLEAMIKRYELLIDAYEDIETEEANEARLDYVERLEETKYELENMKKMECGFDGKMIWSGTADAINATNN